MDNQNKLLPSVIDSAINEISTSGGVINEAMLFQYVAHIAETRKERAAARINQETTLMFWEVGRFINTVVLGDNRASYGKKILSTLLVKIDSKI